MPLLKVVLLFLVVCAARCYSAEDQQNEEETVNLSIVHFNDFHARYEETSWNSTTCRSGDKCIGGLSRLYAAIKLLRVQRPDSIVLDGGDNYQGTVWYNYFKWNVTAYFHNLLAPDATVLGNHEFDNKIAGVIPYMMRLSSPIVVANLNDTLVPEIHSLYSKSIIVHRNGKKIGIIGVLTSKTAEMSSPENLGFLDESESINAEAERLVRDEGVFTNIVLSHCGYDVEKVLAAKATGKISLIVGAHSHSFLYTGDSRDTRYPSTSYLSFIVLEKTSILVGRNLRIQNGTASFVHGIKKYKYFEFGAFMETLFTGKPTPGPDKPWGPYPTEVSRPDGKKVLVVQASAYTKYIGNLSVTFDKDGNYIEWSGKPIFLSTDFPQDEKMNKELQPWKEDVDRFANRVLGETLVTLDKTSCYTQECLMGDFLTDAMIDHYKNNSLGPVSLSVMNAGGIRTSIVKGKITYADLLESSPFENTIDVGDIQGKYIKQFIEAAAEPYDYGRIYSSIRLLQLGGLRVIYDLKNPSDERATSVEILCADCLTPTYEKLDLEKTYRIAIPSFLRVGGDGYAGLKGHITNFTVGPMDIDVFTEYIKKMSPISKKLDNRIQIVNNKHVHVRNVDMY